MRDRPGAFSAASSIADFTCADATLTSQSTASGSAAPPVVIGMKPPSRATEFRSEQGKRIENAPHRPPPQRRIAGEHNLDRRRGNGTHDQARTRPRIAEIEHVRRFGKSADADAANPPGALDRRASPGRPDAAWPRLCSGRPRPPAAQRCAFRRQPARPGSGPDGKSICPRERRHSARRAGTARFQGRGLSGQVHRQFLKKL